MFTGIVQATGVVRVADRSPAGLRLVVDPAGWSHRPSPGDSIAVSGCCLTLAGPPGPQGWAFDAVPQTLALTTLGDWRPGARVNLEHAATPATLLGGHIVQGHVDGVGRVEAAGEAPGRGYRLRVGYPEALGEYLAPQGSICIDGVSLTIADLGPGWLEVALIPATLGATTLAGLRGGDRANLECDVIAKQVVRYLRVREGRPAQD